MLLSTFCFDMQLLLCAFEEDKNATHHNFQKQLLKSPSKGLPTLSQSLAKVNAISNSYQQSHLVFVNQMTENVCRLGTHKKAVVISKCISF